MRLDPNFFVSHIKYNRKCGWLSVKVDGVNRSISSKLLPIQQIMSFNFQTSIPFDSNDTMQTYIYFTLCTYGPQREIIPICKCRSRIGRMSLNGGPGFDLPLIDNNQQIAIISMSGFLEKLISKNGQMPKRMQEMPPQPVNQMPAPPPQNYFPTNHYEQSYTPTNDNNPYFF